MKWILNDGRRNVGTVSISSNAVCQPIKELNNDKENAVVIEEVKEDSSSTALGEINYSEITSKWVEPNFEFWNQLIR